jgi:hypothetical protein
MPKTKSYTQKTQQGGLLEALLSDKCASPSKKASRKGAQIQKGGNVSAQLQQVGGDDSYSWHRATSADPRHNGIANARSHLLAEKRLPWEDEEKSGEAKRAAWINEVRTVMNQSGLNWRDALKEASRRRKATVPAYQTVVERVKNSYTGRKAEDVNCAVCPGKYTKPVARDVDGSIAYRPNAHKVSRAHLSETAATNILRDYYRQRAQAGAYKSMNTATKAMRQDISKVNRSRKIQSPCPTKMTNVTRRDGTVYQRQVVDKTHPDFAQCRSNWLYRATPHRFDMEGIDAGEGRASPAYQKGKLYDSKGRTQRTAKPSRRLARN